MGEVRVADLIQVIAPWITPDQFILSKRFKIVKEVSNANGKWPETMGNGFFIDSNYIYHYLVEMFKNKIFETYKEHQHAKEYYDVTEQLSDLITKRIDL